MTTVTLEEARDRLAALLAEAAITGENGRAYGLAPSEATPKKNAA